MIPSDIIEVNDFPYSATHKIDKKKLINDYLIKQFNGAK